MEAEQPYRNEDVCENKHGGNEQSKLAFEYIKGEPQGRLQKRILSYLRALGKHGATSEELSYKLNLRYTTVSGRISELRREGFIVDRRDEAGKVMRRQNITGCSAAVVIAKECE